MTDNANDEALLRRVEAVADAMKCEGRPAFAGTLGEAVARLRADRGAGQAPSEPPMTESAVPLRCPTCQRDGAVSLVAAPAVEQREALAALLDDLEHSGVCREPGGENGVCPVCGSAPEYWGSHRDCWFGRALHRIRAAALRAPAPAPVEGALREALLAGVAVVPLREHGWVAFRTDSSEVIEDRTPNNLLRDLACWAAAWSFFRAATPEDAAASAMASGAPGCYGRPSRGIITPDAP